MKSWILILTGIRYQLLLGIAQRVLFLHLSSLVKHSIFVTVANATSTCTTSLTAQASRTVSKTVPLGQGRLCDARVNCPLSIGSFKSNKFRLRVTRSTAPVVHELGAPVRLLGMILRRRSSSLPPWLTGRPPTLYI